MSKPLVAWLFGPQLLDAAAQVFDAGNAQSILVCSKSDESLTWAMKSLSKELRAKGHRLEYYAPSGIEELLNVVNRLLVNVPLDELLVRPDANIEKNIIIVDSAIDVSVAEISLIKKLIQTYRNRLVCWVFLVKGEMQEISKFPVGELSDISTGWNVDLGLGPAGIEPPKSDLDGADEIDAVTFLPEINVDTDANIVERVASAVELEVGTTEGISHASWKVAVHAAALVALLGFAIGVSAYIRQYLTGGIVNVLCGPYRLEEEANYIVTRIALPNPNVRVVEGRYMIEYAFKTSASPKSELPEPLLTQGSCSVSKK